jgi:hypothetical protein
LSPGSAGQGGAVAVRTPKHVVVPITWACAALAGVALAAVCWRALDMGEPVGKVAALALLGAVLIPLGTQIGLRRSLRRAGRRGQL